MRNRKKFKGMKTELNITPMMDMFTIVLVFLLRSFAAEGSLLTSAENLVLPQSAKSTTPEGISLNIAADQDWITVDERKVMKTAEARMQDSLNLAPIYQILTEKKSAEEASRLMALHDILPGKIVLQIDRDLEYNIVTKLVATCGRAGYSDIKFVVEKQEVEE